MLLLQACNSTSHVHEVSQDSLVWKWLNPNSNRLTKLEIYWSVYMQSLTMNSFTYKWTQCSIIGNPSSFSLLVFPLYWFHSQTGFFWMSFPKDPGEPPELLNWLCVGPFLSQSMKQGGWVPWLVRSCVCSIPGANGWGQSPVNYPD